MEEKGKEKLTNHNLDNEKKNTEETKVSSEIKESKEKVEPQNIVNTGTSTSLGVDTSEEESEKLGSKRKEEKVEEGSGQVTSYFKLDEKGEKQIKDLLQEELKIEVQDIKKDFLIIFGLFVSFVTFISINVQVFKNSTNLFDIIGVISISLSFIIFFALVINSVVKKQLEWSDLKKPVYIINLLFLIIGLVFILYGENRNNDKIEDLNKKIVNDSLNIEKIISEIDSLNIQLNNHDSTINRLTETVKELKLDSTISMLTETVKELKLDYNNFKDKNESEKRQQQGSKENLKVNASEGNEL